MRLVACMAESARVEESPHKPSPPSRSTSLTSPHSSRCIYLSCGQRRSRYSVAPLAVATINTNPKRVNSAACCANWTPSYPLVRLSGCSASKLEQSVFSGLRKERRSFLQLWFKLFNKMFLDPQKTTHKDRTLPHIAQADIAFLGAG